MRTSLSNLTGLAVLLFATGVGQGDGPEKTRVDAAATKLLSEARTNRAAWDNLPGFRANIEVNLDGKISRGQILVEGSGKVHYQDLDPAAKEWARPVFNSVVSHRLPNDDASTPCVFLDADETHPLGRAIRLVNDPMDSIYRIRDKQITVVDRRIKTRRFTITVQDNWINPEGKYLPTSYAIFYWDLLTGQLEKTESHYQGWKRLDRFDLPVVVRVVTGAKAKVKAHHGSTPDKEALSVRSLTLSNHQLLDKKAK